MHWLLEWKPQEQITEADLTWAEPYKVAEHVKVQVAAKRQLEGELGATVQPNVSQKKITGW